MKPSHLEPLEPELDDLLAAERELPQVPTEIQDRVRARLVAALGPGALGGGGHGGPNSSGPPPTSTTPGAVGQGVIGATGTTLGVPWAIIGIGALAVGGVVVVAAAALQQARRAAPVTVAAVQSSTTAEAQPIEVLDEPKADAVTTKGEATNAPVAVNPPQPPASQDVGTDRARDATLAAERALLDEAQRSLASRQLSDTFRLLARHAQEFPRARLAEEREGLWIRALISAGKLDEARARATRFRRRFPASMLIPALKSTLGEIP